MDSTVEVYDYRVRQHGKSFELYEKETGLHVCFVTDEQTAETLTNLLNEKQGEIERLHRLLSPQAVR